MVNAKTLSDVEKPWVLLENDYVDVKNKDGEVLYHIKEFVDDFTYTYTDSDGHTKKRLLREKRVVTFNPNHVLSDKYGSEAIFDFMHDFRVAKVPDRKYINLTHGSSFIKDLTTLTGLPLTSYFLGNEDINKMLSHRF